MSLGVLLGAGAGFVFGGPAGASLGAQLGGGVDSFITGRTNAHNTRIAGAHNAQQQTLLADYEAAGEINTANLENAISTLGTEFEIDSLLSSAKIDAIIAQDVKLQEASLLREKARQLGENFDLDIERTEDMFNKAIGAAKVGYAASGVVIDTANDTPTRALLSMETEKELDLTILKHNADLSVAEVLDAAAKSEAEGKLAAKKIWFDAQSRANSMLFSNFSQVATNSYNAHSRAASILYKGAVGAGSTRYNSQIRANAQEQAGTRALVTSGIRALTRRV